MGLIESASQNLALRQVFLLLLKLASFNFSIDYLWAPSLQVRLHSFRYKGYWFFGKRREQKSADLFSKLVSSGRAVFDIGGHFATTAGVSGELISHLDKMTGSVLALNAHKHQSQIKHLS